MRTGIEMQKGLAEAEPGEAGDARGAGEARRIVRTERDVEGEPLVHGEWRAADARIVQRATMAESMRSGAFVATRRRSSASSASGQR